MSRRLIVPALLTLAGVVPGAPADAQHPDPHRPVFIAVPDAFPDVGVATTTIVLRAPDKDVILLDRRAATPENLAAAVYALAHLRDEALEPPEPSVHPVIGYVLPEDERPRALARTRGLLRRLQARPPSEVGSLGTGRWIRYGG